MMEVPPWVKLKLGSHETTICKDSQILHSCFSRDSPIQGQEICDFANT